MDYNYLVKVVVIGDSGVGKTSLCDNYIYKKTPCSDPTPTIGVEYFTKIEDMGDIKLKLNIWDTAGQERFSSICRSYYRHSVCALVCFRLNSLLSFDNVNKHIKSLHSCIYPPPHIALIGTFSDDILNRAVQEDDINDICEKYSIKYYETSAKNGSNVNNTFKDICVDITDKIYNGTITVKENNPKNVIPEDISINIDKHFTCCILL